jgi:hypothetical protein
MPRLPASPGSTARVAVSLALAGAFGLASAPAHAIEPELTSDTAAQFYDVRSPTGQTSLDRTRFTSTLGVNLYDILGQDTPGRGYRDGPEIDFRARVRYDADYGISGTETDPTNYQSFVPGLADTSGLVDVMYAYIEGRRLLHGVVSFKLGRQYMVDSLGWWSFDGAEIKATLPYYFAVEGYGGLEVRGGLPLSTARFEAGGVWRGNRNNFDPSLYPQFQPADVAPAVGAAIESSGVTWLHSRLTYRRVYDTGSVGVAEFANPNLPPGVNSTYDQTRISTDKLGYAVEADLRKFGAVKAGLAYDLYNVRFSQIYGSLDVYATKRLTLSADYDFYAPSYDADSIWNVFASEPINDVSLRGSYVKGHLALSAGAHARIYDIDTSNANTGAAPSSNPPSSPNLTGPTYGTYPTNGHPFDEGGDIGAKYKWGEGNVGLRAAADVGDAGDRIGGDLSGQRVLETRYLFAGRLGVWQWNDKIRADRDATNFGYMLGVGYRFAPRCQTMFEWQQDMNRLVGVRFRALLTLSVAIGR